MSIDATLRPIAIVLPAFLVDVIDRMAEIGGQAAVAQGWGIDMAPGSPESRGAMIAGLMAATGVIDFNDLETAVLTRYTTERPDEQR